MSSLSSFSSGGNLEDRDLQGWNPPLTVSLRSQTANLHRVWPRKGMVLRPPDTEGQLLHRCTHHARWHQRRLLFRHMHLSLLASACHQSWACLTTSIEDFQISLQWGNNCDRDRLLFLDLAGCRLMGEPTSRPWLLNGMPSENIVQGNERTSLESLNDFSYQDLQCYLDSMLQYRILLPSHARANEPRVLLP
jgi:hypothetical protein